jgi:hypothetical protein
MYTGRRMNDLNTLDFIGRNFLSMHKKIQDIYGVVTSSPMPTSRSTVRPRPSTFSVGEEVHVGTRPFRIVSINDDTYTLSPNVGGAGGADVIVPKEHVTKGQNHTSEGEEWVRLIDGEELEPEELVRDLSEASCTIHEKVKAELNKHSTMDTRVTFNQDEVAKFAMRMFGYDRKIYDSFLEFDVREQRLLNYPNREYNVAFFKMRTGKHVTGHDYKNAMDMNEIFHKVKTSGMFETQRHGVVYRSFAKDVASAKTVCGTLNRFTSTTVVKNYADKWGTDVDPVTGKQNEEGFFSTIIIPAGTRSIIPLLLFPELDSKRRQYEVLLSPDGILKDTGFVDSGGSKIFIYLEREYCGVPMKVILTTKMRGTNILGFIQCVFGDVTFLDRTGGRKTRRTRKRKHKSKRV